MNQYYYYYWRNINVTQPIVLVIIFNMCIYQQIGTFQVIFDQIFKVKSDLGNQAKGEVEKTKKPIKSLSILYILSQAKKMNFDQKMNK